MSDDFWSMIWRLIIFACLMMVLFFTSCTMHANLLISNAINSGVDPLRAKVAFSSFIDHTELLIARMGEKIDDPK